MFAKHLTINKVSNIHLSDISAKRTQLFFLHNHPYCIPDYIPIKNASFVFKWFARVNEGHNREVSCNSKI